MRFIDVSAHQGLIDWRAVAKSGVQGAYLKATEGRTFNDPSFAKHREAARAAGLRVGAYHFARPDNNTAKSEAAHFAHVLGSVRRDELRPVLDLEAQEAFRRLGAKRLEQWARDFCQEVKRLLGVLPLFYSYGPYIAQMRLSKPIGAGLWIAAYGRNDGQRYPVRIPKPWAKTVMHQFTSAGRVPGIRGKVDVNVVLALNPLLAHPVKARLPEKPKPPVFRPERWVYGDTDVQRDLLVRLAKVGRDLGQRVFIASGRRTVAEQWVLYRRWLARRGPRAAYPGRSNHQDGRAGDCHVLGVNIGSFPGAREALRRHGLCLPVAGERWHVEPGTTWRA